jgi:hypothetical protein
LQKQKIDWENIQDGETYQAFEPLKSPEIVGHFIWGSSGEATLRYRTSREAHALIKAHAGPNREIQEEDSGKPIDPMEVQEEKIYELVYKVPPDSIKFWWDDNLYEFPRTSANAEFWSQIRESVNAKNLQLWGRSGIVQPNFASSKEIYALRDGVRSERLLRLPSEEIKPNSSGISINQDGETKSSKFSAIKIGSLLTETELDAYLES